MIELPGCLFATRVLLRSSARSAEWNGPTHVGVGICTIAERMCVMVPTAPSISILRHRNPYR